jgi:Cu2+-exporting ATPase
MSRAVSTRGRAIARAAREKRLGIPQATGFASMTGRGVKVATITGDAKQVAQAAAQELNINEVFAEILPAGKDK